MASTAWSVLMLLVVLAAIPLVLWALKRLQNYRPAGAPRHLEVTAQIALGARERVVLVRVHDRTLVLGVTPQQVTLLGESAEAAHAPLAPQAHPAPPVAPAAFAGLLKNLTGGPR